MLLKRMMRVGRGVGAKVIDCGSSEVEDVDMFAF